MDSESSDPGGDADDAHRIAPELRDEASETPLSDHEMNERGGFAFVDRIDVGENDDLVEVTFELPFGDETFTRTYEREGADVAYTHPPLSEVFAAAGVPQGDFDSLLTESVPVEDDGDGYSLETTTAPDHPEGTEATEADWLPEGLELYPAADVDSSSVWRRRAIGLASLAATAGAYQFVGWIAAAVVFVVGGGTYFATSPDEYATPEGAREIASTEEVTPGDVIVLDRSLLTSADDRVVVRVTDAHAVGFLVETSDGLTATLRDGDSKWHLEGAVGEQGYETAYELPV